MKKISPATTANSPELSLSSKQRKTITANLPNLSDCNSCNSRFNSANTRNGLRILSSEWRIVLLCNSCYNFIESSQCCSYCLSPVSDSFFECQRCFRRVHRSCVEKFSIDSGNFGDFCVCFDCFVPKLLENDFVRVRGCRTMRNVEVSKDLASFRSSRVFDVKSLEESVNEANVVARNKIALAVAANEKAAAKAAVARRAIELAIGALSFVSVEKQTSGYHEGLTIEDDTPLAIWLRKVMNSSMATDFVNVSTFRKFAVAELEVKGKGSIRDSDYMSFKGRNELCMDETQQNCVKKICGTQDKKYNGDSNGCLITYSRRGRVIRDGSCEEESWGIYPRRFSRVEKHTVERDHCLRTYSRRGRAIKDGSCEEETWRIYPGRFSPVERHNVEHDHCFQTYSRRPSAFSLSENRMQYGGFNVGHGTITSDIALNCCKESTAFANAF